MAVGDILSLFAVIASEYRLHSGFCFPQIRVHFCKIYNFAQKYITEGIHENVENAGFGWFGKNISQNIQMGVFLSRRRFPII